MHLCNKVMLVSHVKLFLVHILEPLIFGNIL